MLERNVIKVVEVIPFGASLLRLLLPATTLVIATVATALTRLEVTTLATFIAPAEHDEVIAVHLDTGAFHTVISGILPDLQLPLDEDTSPPSQILISDFGVPAETVDAIPVGLVNEIAVLAAPASIDGHREIDDRVS